MLGLFGVLQDGIERFNPEQPSERHSIDARLIGSVGLHPIGFPSSVLAESPRMGRALKHSAAFVKALADWKWVVEAPRLLTLERSDVKAVLRLPGALT